MRSTQHRDHLYLKTKLERVTLRSKHDQDQVFNNLGHIIDTDMLRQCFNALDGNKAIGIDGITKERYRNDLESNLSSLLLRIRRGSYHPKGSRIVEIPKVDGSTRPLVISCLEDKIVQSAVGKILEAIYEPLFLDCSHGFRPNRGPQSALVHLNAHLRGDGSKSVVDIDLKQYFNTIPHHKLEHMLRRKITDERFVRLILKLMKTSLVNEDGKEVPNKIGVPQGSILSPLLANIYLHEVLDAWFIMINNQHFRGSGRMTRYADDAIFVFLSADDSEKFMKLLIERLSEFEVHLNEDKTKRIVCGSKEAAVCEASNLPRPSFTFMGFLHVWGKSMNRKTSQIFWRVKRRTCPTRFKNKLKEINIFISKNRHRTGLIGRVVSIVRGYLNYFAINDNSKRCSRFLREVKRILFKYLNRRSQKRSFNWLKFQKILDMGGYPKSFNVRNLFFNVRCSQ